MSSVFSGHAQVVGGPGWNQNIRDRLYTVEIWPENTPALHQESWKAFNGKSRPDLLTLTEDNGWIDGQTNNLN